MKIIIKPEDLVKRCLWDNYVNYVSTKKEAEKLLKENKEMELSEKDAFVINLLKVIETPNLVHKFNTFIMDLLYTKSVENKERTLIRKSTLINAINSYLDKFPEYWKPEPSYKNGLYDLKEYIKEYKEKVSKLPVVEASDQFGTHEFYKSKAVKKLNKFNYF